MTRTGLNRCSTIAACESTDGDRPRRSWLRRPGETDRWQAVAGSVPAGVLAALFWLQDAIDPLTFSSLLLDRILQLLTLAAVPAIVLVLFARVSLALPAVIFVAATGTALASAVLITGVMRPPTDWWVVGGAAPALLLSASLLFRFGPRMKVLKSVPAKVALALLAALVPLLQFWNSVSFLPARTEVALGQEVSVSTVAAATDRFSSEVVFRAKNQTDARVLVIITQMAVCWWKVGEPVNYEPKELRGRTNCLVLRPLTAGSWLAPKSELVYSNAVLTPMDAPRLTIISRVAYARGDRLRVADDSMEEARLGSCQNVEVFHLREESRVKGLAQTNKHLVYADRDGDGGVNFYFDSQDVECPSDDGSELSEYFGTTSSRTVSEKWLTPPSPSRAHGIAGVRW